MSGTWLSFVKKILNEMNDWIDEVFVIYEHVGGMWLLLLQVMKPAVSA